MPTAEGPAASFDHLVSPDVRGALSKIDEALASDPSSDDDGRVGDDDRPQRRQELEDYKAVRDLSGARYVIV